MSEQPVELHLNLSDLLETVKIAKTGGKGEVLPTPVNVNRHARIAEALRRGSLKEQWEAPMLGVDKPTANIIDYIYRSDEIRGHPGDVVNLTVVKPFNAQVLDTPGSSLTAVTGIYSVIQTTLREAGFTTEIPYADVEKISERLIAEIEAQGQTAILRAIDKKILDTIIADTGVPELNKTTAAVYFDADWIAEAIHTIGSQGKTVKPQDFVLVINSLMYKDLFVDVAGSQPIVFALPETIREGLITTLFGVKILVSDYLPTHTTNSYSAFLIHKNAVVFAPKREMLFETERDTAARILNLTGTYTFGIAIVDNKAICEIKTKAVS
ncbi:hypothetical protein KEJ24_09040 [Candidatus Bathyarchaeota archaeon]|nr:hypothetical protein [Candidatus Bathyarchaeota archaeon]